MSKENNDMPIDYSPLYKDFKQHLDIDGNSRILFSAPFGKGKTTYLQSFFEYHKEDYETFHLFPVNYEISSNENIMDYIKYDLVGKLYEQNTEQNTKEDFKNELGVHLKKLAIATGKELKNILAEIPYVKPFAKIIHNFKEESNTDEIKDFLKNMKENDPISEFIKLQIENLKKESSKPKETVLILDDIDRIFPEHIFRILNALSAQFDLHNSNTNYNKFSFDKIIIVADDKNLRNIFHHLYGNKTDSSGYFDKFFSKQIYEFNNTTTMIETIEKHTPDWSHLTGNILKVLIEKINFRHLIKLYDNIKENPNLEGKHENLNRIIRRLFYIIGRNNLLTFSKEIIKNKTTNITTNKSIFLATLKICHDFLNTRNNSLMKKKGYSFEFSTNNYNISKILDSETKTEISPSIVFLDLLIDYIENDYQE